MQKYFNSIQNSRGDAIVGARVTVTTAAGSLATIYSDNGVTTQPNPMTTDGNGFFAFYAADGRYNLRVLAVGIKPIAIDDVLLEDIGTQLTDFEERVYPGIYEAPPTTRPSGAACVEGDRCIIMVGEVGYEHLRSGGSWVIPNIDATTLAMPEGASGVGALQIGTGAVPRDVQGKLREVLSVLDFGADPTGVVDSTAAFNAAAASLAARRTSPPGVTGWGLGTIKIPKGSWLVNGEVACASQLGFRWLGDGEYATTIIRTVDTGNLFNVSTYVGVSFESMTLLHIPASPDRDTWTTSAFLINGTGGGRNLQLKNVTTRNFNTIKKHSTAINEDTNVGEHCTFIDFVSFIDSENPQAVVNTYSNCTWSGAYKRIFWVAGHQNTLVTSGNMVGDGTTIELKNIASKFNDSGFTFINCKLEWTAANAVAGSRPKIIDSVGLFARMKLRFIDCSLFGGPTPHADARFARVTGGGVFDFTGGRIQGKLEMVGNTAIFAKNGDHIKFENVALDDPAGWVFTGGASDSFLPVCIENCPSGSNNPINLTILRGRGVPAIAPRRTVVLGKPGSAESLFFVETVPIDLPSFGSRMLLNSVRIIVRAGTAHTANRIINVYSDAARTVLVATLTMVSNPSANSVHDIPLTGFPVSEAGFFFTVINPVATLYAVIAVDFTTV